MMTRDPQLISWLNRAHRGHELRLLSGLGPGDVSVEALNQASVSPFRWLRKKAEGGAELIAFVDALEAEVSEKGREVRWSTVKGPIRTGPELTVSLSALLDAEDPVATVVWSIARDLATQSHLERPGRMTSLAEFSARYLDFLSQDQIDADLKSVNVKRWLEDHGRRVDLSQVDPRTQLVWRLSAAGESREDVYAEVRSSFESLQPLITDVFRDLYSIFDLDELEQAFKLKYADEQRDALAEMVGDSAAFGSASGRDRSRYIQKLAKDGQLTKAQLALLKRVAKVP